MYRAGRAAWSLLIGFLPASSVETRSFLGLRRFRVGRSGRVLGRSDDALEILDDIDYDAKGEITQFSSPAAKSSADGRSLVLCFFCSDFIAMVEDDPAILLEIAGAVEREWRRGGGLHVTPVPPGIGMARARLASLGLAQVGLAHGGSAQQGARSSAHRDRGPPVGPKTDKRAAELAHHAAASSPTRTNLSRLSPNPKIRWSDVDLATIKGFLSFLPFFPPLTSRQQLRTSQRRRQLMARRRRLLMAYDELLCLPHPAAGLTHRLPPPSAKLMANTAPSTHRRTPCALGVPLAGGTCDREFPLVALMAVASSGRRLAGDP
ncbi:hypothetical protein HU200_063862 [Digitaria exilis]|uniref:Uncharacterized protein n=1 Tax=Digitaria exilis TaxID=1010633 RepID=A0A835A6Q4_9POAL|nr:hypothetical protein HU200_063862 [Digitaria exilis]